MFAGADIPPLTPPILPTPPSITPPSIFPTPPPTFPTPPPVFPTTSTLVPPSSPDYCFNFVIENGRIDCPCDVPPGLSEIPVSSGACPFLGVSVGTTCDVECDEGFEIAGDVAEIPPSQVTCLTGGSFSGVTCVEQTPEEGDAGSIFEILCELPVIITRTRTAVF